MVVRHPPGPPVSRVWKSGVETALELAIPVDFRIYLVEGPDCRLDNLGGKWKAGDRGPRGNGAIVRTEGSAAGQVAKELALDALDNMSRRAGTVAGSQSPAIRAIAL